MFIAWLCTKPRHLSELASELVRTRTTMCSHIQIHACRHAHTCIKHTSRHATSLPHVHTCSLVRGRAFLTAQTRGRGISSLLADAHARTQPHSHTRIHAPALVRASMSRVRPGSNEGGEGGGSEDVPAANESSRIQTELQNFLLPPLLLLGIPELSFTDGDGSAGGVGNSIGSTDHTYGHLYGRYGHKYCDNDHSYGCYGHSHGH